MSGHGGTTSNIALMAIAAVTTALFWGVYGPLLIKGHLAMTVVDVEGKEVSYGRLRPFICVGIAYLIVAIVAPAAFIQFGIMEQHEGLFSGWNTWGIFWSLIAGGAGALGAFFLLVALNYAPTKPYPPPLLVMPLVFGCAPVVNAVFTMWTRNKWNLNPLFLAGMILVAVGAVTVIIGSQITWGAAVDAKEPAPAQQPVEEEVKAKAKEPEEKAETEK